MINWRLALTATHILRSLSAAENWMFCECSQAILDEASAAMDQLKSRASDVAAEMEAAAPVHRRDLAFLGKLDKAQQSAAKACHQILEGSRSMGSETATLLRTLQHRMLSSQVRAWSMPALICCINL